MSVRALIAVTVLALSIVTGPSAARADSVALLNCTGSQEVAFSPPLTNTTRPTLQTVNSQFGVNAQPIGLCVAVGSTITGGGYTTSFTSPRSCLELAVSSGDPLTRTYSWNDSTTTTVSTTRRVERTAGTTVVTFEGTATAGRFAGATVIETIIAVNPDPLICATTGVSSLHFNGNLVIASV